MITESSLDYDVMLNVIIVTKYKLIGDSNPCTVKRESDNLSHWTKPRQNKSLTRNW